MEILPKESQTNLFINLHRKMKNVSEESKRLILVASYGVIVGKLSHRNLMSILNHVDIKPNHENIECLRLYVGMGMLKLDEEGLRAIPPRNNPEYYEKTFPKEIAFIKDELKKVRVKYLENGG